MNGNRLPRPFLDTISQRFGKHPALRRVTSLPVLLRHRGQGPSPWKPRNLTSGIASFTILQSISLAIPIVTVPYLTRTLGPDEWGTLSFFLSVGNYLSVLVEFGVGYWGARDVAANRDDRAARATLLSAILAARLALAAAVVGVAVGGYALSQGPFRSLAYWAGASIYAIGNGSTMLWYYQGLANARIMAFLELPARLGATLLTFALVHKPGRGPLMLFSFGGASLCGTAIGIVLALSGNPVAAPTRRSLVRLWRSAAPMFLFRVASSVYYAGNAILLGMLCSPKTIGYYAAPERLVRAAAAALAPISNAVFPEVSYLLASDPERAKALCRISMLCMVVVGASVSALLFFCAPVIVTIVLGPEFSASTTVLQVLSCLPLVLAVSNTLGIQWMLPRRLDQALTRAIVTAACLHLLAVLLIVPRLQHLGMGICAVFSELWVATHLAITLWRSGKLPL